jgi:rRNA maturation RNase YbeY
MKVFLSTQPFLSSWKRITIEHHEMIAIRNLTKTAIDVKILRKVAKEIFRKDLSVALVGQKRAQELNKIYRKKTYVPNVLSFDYGEVVLCPAKIRKDARKYGIVFEQELGRIFRHGLLHLLGYSHTKMQKFVRDSNFRV